MSQNYNANRSHRNLVPNQFPALTDKLAARAGYKFVEVRQRMAKFLKQSVYSENIFADKFRRDPIPAKTRYNVDELLALVYAFTHGLYEAQRCTPSEAIEIFRLANLPLVQELGDFFPEGEFEAASAYLKKAEAPSPESGAVAPVADPEDIDKSIDYIRPPLPKRMLGRDDDVKAILARLGVGTADKPHSLTVIRGWPGVGKTTLINRLLYDTTLHDSFSDGVLWTSLGPSGDVLLALKQWATQLRLLDIAALERVDEMINRLRLAFQHKKILLVIDDVWTREQANLLSGLYTDTATFLFITRFSEIATLLSLTPADIYTLKVLDEDSSLELLTTVAGKAALDSYKGDLNLLMSSLEGLPLALCVAGALIGERFRLHFDIAPLIEELQTNFRSFKDLAPADRFNEKTGVTPTIGLLFRLSVQTLPKREQLAFACIGSFAPKPATFDFDAFHVICELEDPIETTRILVGRGLLEPLDTGRLQMHFTLAMYALHLLKTDLQELDEELPI